MDGINAWPRGGGHLRLRPRHNENVFHLRRVLVDVCNLLVQISLYAAAKRRIKLGQIADFHACLVIPSEVEESLALSILSRFAGQDQECDSNSLRYLSASIAAAQPEPAAVTACL